MILLDGYKFYFLHMGKLSNLRASQVSCENERNPFPLLLGKLEGSWDSGSPAITGAHPSLSCACTGLRDPRRSMCIWVARIHQLLPVHFLMFKIGRSNLHREVLDQQ